MSMTNSRLAEAAMTKYRTELAQIEAQREQDATEQEKLRAEWLAQETSKLAPTYTRLFLNKMGLPEDSEFGGDLLWYMPPSATAAATFERRENGAVAMTGGLTRGDTLHADIDAITIRAVVDSHSEEENPLVITLVDDNDNHGDPELIRTLYQLGRLITQARERLEQQATERATADET